MLNINPTNSSKIAQSVQRDYQQAAEAHRLAKANQDQSTSHAIVKISLTLSTLVAAIAVFSQLI